MLDTFISQIVQLSYPVIEFLIINSFYSAVLASIVLLIKLIYPKLPKSIEYGFWCLVLIRLLLPNNLSFDYAIINLIESALEATGQSQLVNLQNNSDALSAIIPHQEKNLSILNYVFISWFLVVTLVLLRYLSLRLNLVKMLNKSQPVVDYWPLRCANRWRLNFWIKGRVIIIAADKFLSPFTFSFSNPVIFIPRKILETKNEPLIESIIAHEMAHIKRQDSLWLALQNVIQILYFFNPLVWIIVRQLSSLRENICDDMVLSVNKVKPEDYGNSLLQVLRFNISGDSQSLLPTRFLGHKDQIKKRIASIGNYTLSSNNTFLHFVLVSAFALFLLPNANQKIKQVEVAEKSEKLVSYGKDNSPFPEHIKDQIKLTVVERDVEIDN